MSENTTLSLNPKITNENKIKSVEIANTQNVINAPVLPQAIQSNELKTDSINDTSQNTQYDTKVDESVDTSQITQTASDTTQENNAQITQDITQQSTQDSIQNLAQNAQQNTQQTFQTKPQYYNLKNARNHGVSDEDSLKYLQENTNVDFSQFKDKNASEILETITKEPLYFKAQEIESKNKKISQEEYDLQNLQSAIDFLDENHGGITDYVDLPFNDDLNLKKDSAKYQIAIAKAKGFNIGDASKYISDKDVENAKLDLELLKIKSVKQLEKRPELMDRYKELNGWGNRIADTLQFWNSKQEDFKHFKDRLDAHINVPYALRNDLYTIYNNAEFNNLIEFDSKPITQYLKDMQKVSQNYGFDKVYIDSKTKDIYVEKGGNRHLAIKSGALDNIGLWMDNNPVEIGTMLYAPGKVAKAGYQAYKVGTRGAKAAKVATDVAKLSAVVGAAGVGDSIINDIYSGREVSLSRAASKGVDNAIWQAGTDLGIRALGVVAKKGFQAAKSGVQSYKDFKAQGGNITDVARDTFLSAQKRAVDSKLSNYSKDETQAAYKNFIDTQGDTIIQQEIKPRNMIEKAFYTLNNFNPITYLSAGSKNTQDRLASMMFANPRISKEFSGLINAEQAEIASHITKDLGNMFRNEFAKFEKQMIDEYVATGNTAKTIENIPQLFKHLTDEVDLKAKNRYGEAVKGLANVLNDVDFKPTILQSYKDITDKAISELGFNNELSKTLFHLTDNIESKSVINLEGAIEQRKRLNQLLSEYDKKQDKLLSFKANENLDALKKNIDNDINNALNMKVANNEISPEIKTQLYNEFMDANKEYAEVKSMMKDKFTQAIRKGLTKKDLDSRLTTEQWYKRTLDREWNNSANPLSNTIFSKFSPKMQEQTQMLNIFRALDRNISGLDDNVKIDFEKILKDLNALENVGLHPNAYKTLDIIKKYANAYRFIQDFSAPTTLKTGTDSGIGTTLIGRFAGAWAGFMFKRVLAIFPYFGKNLSLQNTMHDAIKNLRHPRELSQALLDTILSEDAKRVKNGAKVKSESFTDYPLNSTQRDSKLASEMMQSDKEATTILTPNEAKEIYKATQDPNIAKIENEMIAQEKIQDLKDNLAPKITKTSMIKDIDTSSVADSNVDKNALKQAILNNDINEIKITKNGIEYQYNVNGDIYAVLYNKHQIPFIKNISKPDLEPNSYENIKAIQNEEDSIDTQLIKALEYKENEAKLPSYEREKIADSMQGESVLSEFEKKQASKETDSIESNIKSDLLDKSKPLRMANKDELTDELLNEAIKQDSKLWIGNLENKQIAEALGMDTSKPIKLTLKGSTITHILREHGADSVLAKNGQPPINLNDIKMHDNIINNADILAISKTDDGQLALTAGKQINGYHVVVEVISKKKNELSLKTEYKENGILSKDSQAFRNAEGFLRVTQQETPRGPLGPKPSTDLDNAPTAKGNDTIESIKMQDSIESNLSPQRQKEIANAKTYKDLVKNLDETQLQKIWETKEIHNFIDKLLNKDYVTIGRLEPKDYDTFSQLESFINNIIKEQKINASKASTLLQNGVTHITPADYVSYILSFYKGLQKGYKDRKIDKYGLDFAEKILKEIENREITKWEKSSIDLDKYLLDNAEKK